MDRTFTFDITKERYNRVKKQSSNISLFINQSIDFYIIHLQTRHLQDFMYMIGLPFLVFLIMTGLTLYFATLFFYLLTSISGIYFTIFVFLFYNKYRGVKWR